MGVPQPEQRNDQSTYEKAKKNINLISSRMEDELKNLNALHHLETDQTISAITNSLNTLQSNITFQNKTELSEAWNNFALRTPAGAKAFLETIKDESGGQSGRYFNMVVMATQTLLRKKEFLKNGDQTAGTEWIDGIRGPITQAAVLNFKREWNKQHPHDTFDTTGNLKYTIGKKMIQALLSGEQQQQEQQQEQEQQQQEQEQEQQQQEQQQEQQQQEQQQQEQQQQEQQEQQQQEQQQQEQQQEQQQGEADIINITPQNILKEKTTPQDKIAYLQDPTTTALQLAGETANLNNIMGDLGNTPERKKLLPGDKTSINNKVSAAICYQELQKDEQNLNTDDAISDLQTFLNNYVQHINKLQSYDKTAYPTINQKMTELIIEKQLNDEIPKIETASQGTMKTLKDKYINLQNFPKESIKDKVNTYIKEINTYKNYWEQKISSLDIGEFIKNKKVLEEAFGNYDKKTGKINDKMKRHFNKKQGEIGVSTWNGQGILTLYNKVAQNELTLENKNKTKTHTISQEINDQSEWKNILTSEQDQYKELYKQIITNNSSSINLNNVLYGNSQTSN